MYTTPNFNRYSVDAEIAHRHSQIREDYSPRRGPKRHLSLPKLPSWPALPLVRFRRPSLFA